MRKTALLSIALITAVFLSAVAQNHISMPERYQVKNAGFEYPDFETPKLPAIKKAKSGQAWWEPDTVYFMYSSNESAIYRFVNKYNSHGLLKERIEQFRNINPANTDSSWISHSSLSYTYTYDSSNNVLTCLENNSKLYTYTYDSSNNVLTRLRQNWHNNSGENLWLYTYTYDSNNNRLTELEQNWKNNSWENYQLYTYTYDFNNNVLTERGQFWKNIFWSDVVSLSYTYTYDSNNNVLTCLVNKTLITYTYDSNNNRIAELWQRGSNNSWVTDLQNLRTYDENNNGISVESWRWENESWKPNNNLTSGILLYYNNMQSNFWRDGHKLTASYTKVSDLTSIAEPPTTPDLNTISIYPNPTAGAFKIETGAFKIQQVSFFDISGVNVFNTQQTALDVSHLPAGMYFVQIKTEKGVVTKKVVKL